MRAASVSRETKETQISVSVDLDGTGSSNVETGIGFFDHMLEGFSKHGFFDLDVQTEGDLQVDVHHCVEDTGIVLGQAIKEALGDKKGIRRFGDCIIPMDDALALCAIDLCGRPYFVFDAEFSDMRIGEMDTQTIREFFYAISYSCGMNLHIKLFGGVNDHHKAEAIFKAFGKALDMATSIDPRVTDVLSTKGTL